MKIDNLSVEDIESIAESNAGLHVRNRFMDMVSQCTQKKEMIDYLIPVCRRITYPGDYELVNVTMSDSRKPMLVCKPDGASIPFYVTYVGNQKGYCIDDMDAQTYTREPAEWFNNASWKH